MMETTLGCFNGKIKYRNAVHHSVSLAPPLTGAGDHCDGALALLAAALGLNELGAAEEGVSPLALRAVGLVAGGERRL